MPVQTISQCNIENGSDEHNDLMPTMATTDTIQATKISEAIKASDMTMLNMYLKTLHTDIKSYRSKFGTVLHIAASCASSSFLKQLIDCGLDLSCQSTEGSTALHIASKLGRHDLVELMLSLEDIDDTVRNKEGLTAAEVSKTRQVSNLFEYARNNHQLKKTREMHHLLHKGNVEGLKRIFQSPRNRHLLDINAFDAFGDSPLHIAARSNNLELVLLCIELGADPYLKNRKNKLPIELCKEESVRACLREAPMVQPSNTIYPQRGGIKIEGLLSKWTNYAEGFKKRWFVLEDGILSYYKSQAEHPVNCRGSVNVQFCRVYENPTDKYRFEVVCLNGTFRYHLRAESVAEAKKWVIAINESKDSSGQSTRMSESLDTLTDKLKPHKHAVESCFDLLACSESCLLQLYDVCEDDNVKPDTQRIVLEYIAHQTGINNSFKKHLIDLESLEVSRDSELAAEGDRLRMMETSIQEFAAENRKMELWSKHQHSWDDVLAEEFFDVLEFEASNKDTEQSSSNTDTISINGSEMQEYSMQLRSHLPCSSATMPPVNLWSILKGLIGKDLFKFPLPVNFSEPLSMLQRLAEDIEYAELLDKAVLEEDPMKRIQYVAAFAVSCYSSTENRMTKPFNPLLGETFEYANRGLRYISEQVSHHPPISACHCEGKGWVYWSEVNVTNKFLGKSLDIKPEGWNHVTITSTGDHYVWKKVHMSIYNLIVGKLWIDHYGTMLIENKCNGQEICELEFKAHGWRGIQAKRVMGSVCSRGSNAAEYEIDGHWNTALISRNLCTATSMDLWRRHSPPPDAEQMYMFTRFAITLNQIDPDMGLCPTDSRFRPDQRAMEEGRWEEANEMKVKLEEKQRSARKQPGLEYKPRWFVKEPCETTGETQWTYIGGYWEAKESGGWSQVQGIPDIFL